MGHIRTVILAIVLSITGLLGTAPTAEASPACSISACARTRAIPTPQSYFETLSQRFDRDASSSTDAVVQWTLTGAEGGSWYAVIAGEQLTVRAGEASNADLTITMDATDYVAMVNQEVNGKLMFMTGRGKAEGSIPLAMKLNRIFPLD
ncbi:MAG: SCP2 sterol-binding domain-containing protein [Deltaproteobacteria bacterium]|nr:SCP2 sterol-binding domain-containing protein [Deltaproteobacteria bacterium]